MSETPARYCGNCGNELDPEDRFCQNCGRPMHQTAQVPTPEADVPVPPPPQQEEAGTQPLEQADAQPREPWTTRQYALGCLGAFFVVFVVGAFVAALAGSGGGGNEAQKNKKGGGGKDTAPKPELVVSSPSGSPTVTSDTIEVEGEVTPATSKVTVNGEGVTPADDGSFSTPLHLNVGENYIQITAEKGSEQADAARTVTRKLPEKETAAQEAPQVQKNEQQQQEHKASNPAPKPVQKKPAPKPQYASVGEKVPVDDEAYQVNKAWKQNGIHSVMENLKGTFVVVDFTFYNMGSGTRTLDETALKLKDSQGRSYDVIQDNSLVVPMSKDIFLEDVSPGVYKQGRAIFSVAPTANGFVLVCSHTNWLSSAEPAKIKLGF